MKQTLEEAAEKYFDHNIFCDGITAFEKEIAIRSYIAGAKLLSMENEIGQIKEIDKTKITRIEVINHATTEHGLAFGRILTLHKEIGDFKNIELAVQDQGRTLKIFLG